MTDRSPTEVEADFEESAAKRRGFFTEWASFALNNKRWWITPIVVVLTLVAAFAVLTASGAGPFVYSLF